MDKSHAERQFPSICEAWNVILDVEQRVKVEFRTKLYEVKEEKYKNKRVLLIYPLSGFGDRYYVEKRADGKFYYMEGSGSWEKGFEEVVEKIKIKEGWK